MDFIEEAVIPVILLIIAMLLIFVGHMAGSGDGKRELVKQIREEGGFYVSDGGFSKGQEFVCEVVE